LHFPESQVKFDRQTGEHAEKGELQNSLNDPGPRHESLEYDLNFSLSNILSFTTE
jgi:hypothetical protein